MALRVLAVAQAAELGGAELALLRVAPFLAEEGIELELAVPGAGAVADAARERALPVHQLTIGPLRTGGWPRAVRAWPQTRALVRRVKPGVVWLNGVVPQRLVPALGRVPALLHLHDIVEESPRAWRAERFWQRVPLVGCASQAVADAAREAGAPADRLRVVPEPVEVSEPAPRPDWAGGGRVVGFVGRIEPRKGVLDLLAAAERMQDVHIVIVRGPDVEPDAAYQRLVAERSAALGDAVTTIGPVPDASALMPWFDVLCVPSLVEPFGTVAAEALAAGTPAVVTDSGGMPEYVVPGRNGDVVPVGDPARLAEALERTLGRAGSLAGQARADAAHFATPVVARDVASLLLHTEAS